MAKKGQFIVNDRFCSECGKQLWKYTKANNKQNLDLCRFCSDKKRKRLWICIDCGVAVNRKVKRCKDCNQKTLSQRGSYLRTETHRQNMSIVQRTHPSRLKYYKSRIGIKRPEHSDFLKKWWEEHPEEKEKAKQRGKEYAENIDWIKRISRFGEKNAMWQGGIANSKYKGFYQKLKDKIRKRDNFTCQLCGRIEKEFEYHLSIHHINFNKEDNREENLNALCKRCNSLINFKRKEWTKYFQEKLAEKGIAMASYQPEML